MGDREWRLGDQLEATEVTQEKKDGDLDEGWTLDKAELTGFADGLDAGDEKREGKENFKYFGRSNWVFSVSVGESRGGTG